jgi:predicted secreted protein
MSWTTGIATYLVIWWVVIFAVLPWGIKVVGGEDVSRGHASSAPVRPRILAKMAVTSVVAAVLWGLVYTAVALDWVRFP